MLMSHVMMLGKAYVALRYYVNQWSNFILSMK